MLAAMSHTAVDVVYKDGVLKPEGDAPFAGALQDSARYRLRMAKRALIRLIM